MTASGSDNSDELAYVDPELLAAVFPDAPRFEHDCNGCEFKANLKWRGIMSDVYFCKGESEERRTIVIRYGSDGPEYSSGCLFECVELTSIDRFALSHGIELNEFERERLLNLLIRLDKSKLNLKEMSKIYPEDGKENALGNKDWYDWKY